MVRSTYLHDGAIRGAIHALKYRGIDPIASELAPLVAAQLPEMARALVPIPRSPSRLIRYGIDQALTLARYMGRETDLPVVQALRAPVFHTSQLHRRSRFGQHFRLVRPVPRGAVLVDDVVTTGATLQAAGLVCGARVQEAVTITRAALR